MRGATGLARRLVLDLDPRTYGRMLGRFGEVKVNQVQRLEELWNRIGRVQNRLCIKSGPGFKFSAKVDGDETHYQVLNLKHPEEYKDCIHELIVWVWSCKDHIVKAAVELGADKSISIKSLNNFINRSRELSICLDLANSIKHSGLDNPGWSGLGPEIKEVGFSTGMKSVRRLTVGNDGITLDIESPENVIFHARVRDRQGNYLGDAMDLVEEAIKQWSSLIKIET